MRQWRTTARAASAIRGWFGVGVGLAAILFLSSPLAASNDGVEPSAIFDPADGSRIVFLGNTLIERDQSFGYLEARLTRRWPDRNLIFRNLGWSGDTVFGDARAGFETATEGYQRLVQHVNSVKPTHIIVAYGGVESFEGEPGLTRFVEGYKRLLDDLAKTKAQLILITPPPQEKLGSPYPDPTVQNRHLKIYSHSIRDLAKERNLRIIDLFGMMGGPGLTSNGVHLHEQGYQAYGEMVERALGLKPIIWKAEFDKDGKALDALSPNLVIDEVERTKDSLKFRAKSKIQVVPPSVWADFDERHLLIAPGLSVGEYVLKIDGKEMARNDFAAWARGVAFWVSPDQKEFDALRGRIREKNLLYFYRWRPQNETYLFGFRKHEQGQNAREMPMFDPLVVEQEKQIAKTNGSSSHRFELVRVGDLKAEGAK